MTDSSAFIENAEIICVDPHTRFYAAGNQAQGLMYCMLGKQLTNWATAQALLHCILKSYQASLNCLCKGKEACLTGLDFTSKQAFFHLKRWYSVFSQVACKYAAFILNIYKDYREPKLSL